jgi:hypothetical protein
MFVNILTASLHFCMSQLCGNPTPLRGSVIFRTFIQFLYDNIITPIQCLWYPVALKNKKKYTTLIFKIGI